MRICIFGAGAIGGYMGAKLAGAGAEVGLVARGPHLKAMRENGLTLIEEGEASGEARPWNVEEFVARMKAKRGA